MMPIAAFSDCVERARHLVWLHDGLADVGRRGIRRDWARSIWNLMRWPAGARINRVDSADVVVILRHDASMSRGDFAREAREGLLRCPDSARQSLIHARAWPPPTPPR